MWFVKERPAKKYNSHFWLDNTDFPGYNDFAFGDRLTLSQKN